MDTAAGKKVRKRGKGKPFLPDEIITTNILIRLPVKSAIRCRLVCRKWRDIILTRHFVDLHQRSSIPLILVGKRIIGSPRLNLFAIDKWWDLSRTRSMFRLFPFRAADFLDASVEHFSHAGLIVLRSLFSELTKFIILNPVRPSDECVEIKVSRKFCGDIRAVYYHPFLKEYCALWMIDKPDSDKNIQYKVLNLGSNPSFKTVCDSFDYRVKDKEAYPLFVNDRLYWMLKSEQNDKFGGRNDILEFDIISEEFMVIPCPIPLNTECKKHQTHLLNSDDVLSFVLILPSTITIWKLEDCVHRLWTINEYTINLEICHDNEAVGIVAVVDGMLAFRYNTRLCVCDLRVGTLKKYPEREYTGGNVLFLSHQMSLASLINCKDLYIEEDGKVFD